MYEVRKTYLGFAVVNTETGIAQSSFKSLDTAQKTARDLNWNQRQLDRNKKAGR